jgi:hypothetical protein
MTNEGPTIGHNNPPTPFDDDKRAITDLYDEAALWLDGEKVETQQQADAINTLKDRIKKAAKAADENRKTEQKPWQDEINASQERYNTLIGNNKSVKGLAVKAEEACNAALRPYLIELDRRQQEEARLAREEADRKQAEALEAMRARDAANISSQEAAERLVEEAKIAANVAKQAASEKAHAKGDGRATGLRIVHKPYMTDQKEAAAWVWMERREDLLEFIQQQAEKAVRSGARNIRGFEVREEKVL